MAIIPRTAGASLPQRRLGAEPRRRHQVATATAPAAPAPTAAQTAATAALSPVQALEAARERNEERIGLLEQERKVLIGTKGVGAYKRSASAQAMREAYGARTRISEQLKTARLRWKSLDAYAKGYTSDPEALQAAAASSAARSQMEGAEQLRGEPFARRMTVQEPVSALPEVPKPHEKTPMQHYIDVRSSQAKLISKEAALRMLGIGLQQEKERPYIDRFDWTKEERRPTPAETWNRQEHQTFGLVGPLEPHIYENMRQEESPYVRQRRFEQALTKEEQQLWLRHQARLQNMPDVQQIAYGWIPGSQTIPGQFLTAAGTMVSPLTAIPTMGIFGASIASTLRTHGELGAKHPQEWLDYIKARWPGHAGQIATDPSTYGYLTGGYLLARGGKPGDGKGKGKGTGEGQGKGGKQPRGKRHKTGPRERVMDFRWRPGRGERGRLTLRIVPALSEHALLKIKTAKAPTKQVLRIHKIRTPAKHRLTLRGPRKGPVIKDTNAYHGQIAGQQAFVMLPKQSGWGRVWRWEAGRKLSHLRLPSARALARLQRARELARARTQKRIARQRQQHMRRHERRIERHLNRERIRRFLRERILRRAKEDEAPLPGPLTESGHRAFTMLPRQRGSGVYRITGIFKSRIPSTLRHHLGRLSSKAHTRIRKSIERARELREELRQQAESFRLKHIERGIPRKGEGFTFADTQHPQRLLRISFTRGLPAEPLLRFRIGSRAFRRRIKELNAEALRKRAERTLRHSRPHQSKFKKGLRYLDEYPLEPIRVTDGGFTTTYYVDPLGRVLHTVKRRARGGKLPWKRHTKPRQHTRKKRPQEDPVESSSGESVLLLETEQQARNRGKLRTEEEQLSGQRSIILNKHIRGRSRAKRKGRQASRTVLVPLTIEQEKSAIRSRADQHRTLGTAADAAALQIPAQNTATDDQTGQPQLRIPRVTIIPRQPQLHIPLTETPQRPKVPLRPGHSTGSKPRPGKPGRREEKGARQTYRAHLNDGSTTGHYMRKLGAVLAGMLLTDRRPATRFTVRKTAADPKREAVRRDLPRQAPLRKFAKAGKQSYMEKKAYRNDRRGERRGSGQWLQLLRRI